MSIILCGFKNCGKTTLATAFSKATGWRLLDTDHVMLNLSKFNGSISELYKSLGEENFRSLEAEIISSLQPQTKRIIATGGGTMMNHRSSQQLRALGSVIYLNEAQSTLLNRMLASDKLPSFIDASDPENSFKEYYIERHKIYKKCADDTIVPSEQSIEANIKSLEKIGNSYVQQ